MANPPPKDSAVVDEPKTLSEAELSSFREAALEIINTHTKEEATQIFLAGLKPPTQPPAPKPKESKPKGSSSKKLCGKRSRHN